MLLVVLMIVFFVVFGDCALWLLVIWLLIWFVCLALSFVSIARVAGWCGFAGWCCPKCFVLGCDGLVLIISCLPW